MAKIQLSNGVQAILARYQADAENNKVGEVAFKNLSKISNNDPSESVFEKGEIITLGSVEELKASCVVRRFGTREIAAFAVDTSAGSKLLYLSSLRKSVPEYEKTPEGIVTKKDANGRTIVHPAEADYSELRKEVMKCGTAAAIAEKLANKKIEVVDISEPIQTARFEQVVDPATGRTTNQITGLRTTQIYKFEFAE